MQKKNKIKKCICKQYVNWYKTFKSSNKKKFFKTNNKKKILAPLGITAAASVIDAGI